MLRGAWKNGRSFGKSLDELVEKFFCSDLQMEGVAAILDEVVQQLWLSVLSSASSTRQERVEKESAHMESKNGDVRVPRVDLANDLDSCLSRRVGLLLLDVVGQLQVEAEIWLSKGRVTAPL